jgi:hypothetical protein
MWSFYFYFSHVRSTFPFWDTPKFSLVSDLGGCRQLDTYRQLDALLYAHIHIGVFARLNLSINSVLHNHIFNYLMIFGYQNEIICWFWRPFSLRSDSIQHDFQVVSWISNNSIFDFLTDGMQCTCLFLHKFIKQTLFKNSESSIHQTWLRQRHRRNTS